MSERTMGGLAAARARSRPSGQKPKPGSRRVQLARQMYDERDDDGKRRYTVAQIAAEFGITRPTICRHLGKPSTRRQGRPRHPDQCQLAQDHLAVQGAVLRLGPAEIDQARRSSFAL
ncbi:hypothetical protein AB0K15_28425 [Amycolatopsis sp. NPDC049253]|uniref:hypothetical protein n=1 Tax=Amycolatopsis sp. NPDC049253 TaxID=3155274 RepID=UPI003436B0B9